MRIIFDTHTQAGWGGGSSHEPATREQGRVEICDSRRGRSFDVGVKTQRPRRGTHAETLRDREQSESNQRRRRVRKDGIIITIRTKFLSRSGTLPHG